MTEPGAGFESWFALSRVLSGMTPTGTFVKSRRARTRIRGQPRIGLPHPWMICQEVPCQVRRALPAVSRETLPVAQRLTRILEHNACPSRISRSPDSREIGTCRDLALMLCSMPRGKGIAARPRCGFASYFNAGWEDHWVCEYWDSRRGSGVSATRNSTRYNERNAGLISIRSMCRGGRSSPPERPGWNAGRAAPIPAGSVRAKRPNRGS